MEEEGDRRRWGSQPLHKHQPDTSDANTSLWLFFPVLCGPRTTQDQRKRPGVHYPFLGNILSSLNLNHTSLRREGETQTGWKVVAERSALCHCHPTDW